MKLIPAQYASATVFQPAIHAIASGPVVFGLGPSASGFGIGAPAVMKDQNTVNELLRSLSLIGLPVMEKNELRYQAMPIVGQAVILFGKTAALR